MKNEKSKPVSLRPKGNKSIVDEPEMKELKRMIRDGELGPERTAKHLHEGNTVNVKKPSRVPALQSSELQRTHQSQSVRHRSG